METKLIVIGYLIYVPLAIVLTLFVARTLFKSGKVFMLDIFKGREDIASATNKLFEVGFYLVNVGFALLILKMTNIQNNQDLIEGLSYKVGGFSIYLGCMLFFNLFFFFRGKRKAKEALEDRKLTEALEARRNAGYQGFDRPPNS